MVVDLDRRWRNGLILLLQSYIFHLESYTATSLAASSLLYVDDSVWFLGWKVESCGIKSTLLVGVYSAYRKMVLL